MSQRSISFDTGLTPFTTFREVYGCSLELRSRALHRTCLGGFDSFPHGSGLTVHLRMLCARVINGIGTGCLNAIVPVWSAEVATHTSRGAFIASEFTLNIFGVVIAYWLEFGLGFVADGNTQVRWRVGALHRWKESCLHYFQFPIAFQILPVLAFMVSANHPYRRNIHRVIF